MQDEGLCPSEVAGALFGNDACVFCLPWLCWVNLRDVAGSVFRKCEFCTLEVLGSLLESLAELKAPS